MADVNITISADDKDLKRSLDRIKQNFAQQEQQGKKAFTSIFSTGISQAKLFTANLAANLAANALSSAFGFVRNAVVSTISAIADFEAALVGVGKTTNLEGRELKSLGDEIERLSTTIPVAATGLLEIARAGGQLGITGSQNILRFTDTVAKLGFATDLEGEQAALTLTRLLEITGDGVEVIDRLGASIVELGNNFAATEAEIADGASEVARATAVFNIGSANAAAFGATLKSLGIESRIGGTTIGKAFRTIEASINAGGDSLRDLAEITGLTGAEITQTFETDASRAFQLFIEGVGRAVEGGRSAADVFAQFGLTGEGVLKVLPLLATRTDILAKSLRLSNSQFQEATALNKEAEKAFETLSGQYQIATNRVAALQRIYGQALMPTLKSLVAVFNDFAGVQVGVAQSSKNAESTIATLEQRLNMLRSAAEKTADGPWWAQMLGAGRDSINKDIEAIERRIAIIKEEQKVSAAKKEQEAMEQASSPDAQEEIMRATIQEQELQLKLKTIRDEARILEYEEKLLFEENLGAEATAIAVEKERDRLAKIRDAEQLALAERKNDSAAFETAKAQIALNGSQRRLNIKKLESEEEKRIDKETKYTIEEQQRDLISNLKQLSGSGSKALFRLSQGAAIAEAVMNAEVAATKAWVHGGPFLGPVLAAAVIASTAVNINRIRSQKPPSFQDGGIVPGQSFQGDQVAARVNSGEMILNRQQQARLFDMANRGGSAGQREIVVNTTVELDGEKLGLAVSRQVADGLNLGVAR